MNITIPETAYTREVALYCDASGGVLHLTEERPSRVIPGEKYSHVTDLLVWAWPWSRPLMLTGRRIHFVHYK
mgnify:CR=1 FL=1